MQPRCGRERDQHRSQDGYRSSSKRGEQHQHSLFFEATSPWRRQHNVGGGYPRTQPGSHFRKAQSTPYPAPPVYKRTPSESQPNPTQSMSSRANLPETLCGWSKSAIPRAIDPIVLRHCWSRISKHKATLFVAYQISKRSNTFISVQVSKHSSSVFAIGCQEHRKVCGENSRSQQLL